MPLLYTAEEAAALLRCSAWWLKKEAREGRAPHTLIGGAYRFTRQHLDAVIEAHEGRGCMTSSVPSSVNPVRRPVQVSPDDTVPLLRARPPRRARGSRPASMAA
ncbi:helix-turn-helix domain-containing protein [Dactylosporangium sp. McL0621]|uniref:helix-turn-helix domain-containing protein n=1 Tax=Dactylosporangium sp. McL0621 TaxID=3415678 RepID=UPI003CE727C7